MSAWTIGAGSADLQGKTQASHSLLWTRKAHEHYRLLILSANRENCWQHLKLIMMAANSC